MVRLWTARDCAQVLRMPTDADDKYSRGVLGMRTGSKDYPGAAVLGVEAAWRFGIGMVRYLGPARATELVLQRRPETVAAEGRVQAWVVGSGMDAATRSDATTRSLRVILAAEDPVVVDAGALDLAADAGAPVIVTPHGREFERLCDDLGVSADASADRESAAARAASALGGVVLLKGARTLVAIPGGEVVAVEAGTPWLATAGTGDVLAGAIGALVAARAASAMLGAADLAAIAATGAWLHGAAARVAAGQCTAADAAAGRGGQRAGHPVVALEVAHTLSEVVGALLVESPPAGEQTTPA